MGFWNLLEVASAPIIQVGLISAVGAFLATEFCNNLLSAEFRKSLNKIVFIVFTPSLIFVSFAKSVSLDDMISWWFMPVNIGLTFIIGGILGWIIVKVLKPNLKVEGLILASCSTGNMGNLPVVIIPAICDQKGGPFGTRDECRIRALSYSFFSLAVGGVFIWTFTYQLIRNSSMKYKAFEAAQILKVPNKELDANAETRLLKGNDNGNTVIGDTENQIIVNQGLPNDVEISCWHIMIESVSNVVAEIMSPPTIATFLGFLFGGVKWLRHLIIGQDAPLRVISDSIQLLGVAPAGTVKSRERSVFSLYLTAPTGATLFRGSMRSTLSFYQRDGTIPCITILLGGNLTQGMQSSCIQPLILISIIIARLFLLPAIGFFVVKAAANFGFLPLDPLFQYVLVIQYALPPAMNISTMAQLFDVGTEEFSVILLWTYGAAVIALTLWSTFLIWVLS